MSRLVLKFTQQRDLLLFFVILPALTPKDYKIRIFNRRFFWRSKDFSEGVLVGITCTTSSSPQAYRLADRYRKAGAYVVMGGPHVSCLPDEALQHCHSVVIGEAESVWSEVIRDFENMALKRIYRGEPLQDFFSPSYEYLLNLNPKIFFRSGIMLSRGCKYHCEFCSQPFGEPRYANLEQVINIIRKMRGAIINPFNRRPGFVIKDDNIFANPIYAKTLFKELIPLKIRWIGNSCIDIAFDEEALKLAKESGCKMIFIGFETIYPQKLAKTSVHNMLSTKDYIKAIKKIRSYGIKVLGAFIIGFDYYSHLDYLKLLLFFIISRFYLISLTILTPYPGSVLHERLKKENRIIIFDWGKYAFFNIVFRPKHMTTFSVKLWFVILRIVSVCSSIFMSDVILAIFLAYLVFNITYNISHYIAGQHTLY